MNKVQCQISYIQCINPFLNKWVIQFDYNEEKQEFQEEIVFNKPSFQEVKEIITKYYNSLCDEAILSGFRFEGNVVWLNMENQQNYKAAFDLAIMTKGQGGTLPVTFKFGTETEPVYRKFETLEDLQNFYISAVKYIQETLAKYWKIKDSIDWSVYENLLK